MKRVAVAVVAAMVAVWGLFLLDVSEPHPRAAARETPPAAALPLAAKPVPMPIRTVQPEPTTSVAAVEPVLRTEAAPLEAIASPLQAAPQATAPLTHLPPDAPKSVILAAAAAERARSYASAVEPAFGQLGINVRVRMLEAVKTSYAHEPRDGAWAPAKEERIRRLLEQANLGPRTLNVHCRTSVCMVHLDAQSQAPLTDLLAVPGLKEEAGFGSSPLYTEDDTGIMVYMRPVRGQE